VLAIRSSRQGDCGQQQNTAQDQGKDFHVVFSRGLIYSLEIAKIAITARIA
jgi:hypothetical protein